MSDDKRRARDSQKALREMRAMTGASSGCLMALALVPFAALRALLRK